jgi:hypothetical protein
MKQDSFLGIGRETNDGTTPIARQQILNNATVGLQQWKSCVYHAVRAEGL